MSHIGNVPVFFDESTGEVSIDQDELEGLVGSFGGGRGVDRRVNRLSRRLGRLQDKQAQGNVDAMGYAQGESPADIYSAAAAAGLITENQINGLGSVALVASGTGALTDTINRTMWAKSIVLDSDSPEDILVTGITVAGIPIHIGSKGTPLAVFEKDSTRFGISFGRRMAMTGQSFEVDLSNLDAGAAHTVTGGLVADELDPYVYNRWIQMSLLQAIQATGPGF
jgi:hypothetical protein